MLAREGPVRLIARSRASVNTIGDEDLRNHAQFEPAMAP